MQIGWEQESATKQKSIYVITIPEDMEKALGHLQCVRTEIPGEWKYLKTKKRFWPVV